MPTGAASAGGEGRTARHASAAAPPATASTAAPAPSLVQAEADAFRYEHTSAVLASRKRPLGGSLANLGVGAGTGKHMRFE